VEKTISLARQIESNLLILGARANFTYTKHHGGGVKNNPRHISGTMAPRNKISTAIPPIFEVKLLKSANADFLSRDLIPEINMATVKMQASSVFLHNEGRKQN
jgi:hypothetical protein